MPLVLNVLLAVGFAGLIGAVVRYWRLHLETARRDDMQALAARRGWALTVTGERLGRAGTLRLTPRGGLPWLAEARPTVVGQGSAATVYEADAPRWAEGTLVMIAAPLPARESLGPERWERLLREHLGDAAEPATAKLSALPPMPGVTILSHGDPSFRVDLASLAHSLSDWAPVGAGPRARPVMVLSPQGLRLRLSRQIKRPDQMERFLDLALQLSRLIGP